MGETRAVNHPWTQTQFHKNQVLPQPHRAQACLLALRPGPEFPEVMRVGEKGALELSHSYQALTPTLANGVWKGGHPGELVEEKTLGWVGRVLGSSPNSSSPTNPSCAQGVAHILLFNPRMGSVQEGPCYHSFTAKAAEVGGREGTKGTWLRSIRQSHRVLEPGALALMLLARSPTKLDSMPQVTAQGLLYDVIKGPPCTLRQTWPLSFQFLNLCPSVSLS